MKSTKSAVLLQLRARFPDVSLFIIERTDVILLMRIEVPADARGKGVGTAVMRELCAYADALKTRISLTPSVDFGGKRERLVRFYARFGFVEDASPHRNEDVNAMNRAPR